MSSAVLGSLPLRRGRNSLWLAPLLALLAGLSPANLHAQAGSTGTLTGHVRGPGGVSVPGATVVLTNPQSGERKATWTDEAGNYVFNGLTPGNYKLEASLVGFRTDVREPIPVTEGKTLKVNVALMISTPESANASGATTLPSGARLPGNLQALPAQMQASMGAQGMEPALTAGMNENGNGGTVRFSDEQSAGGHSGRESRRCRFIRKCLELIPAYRRRGHLRFDSRR